MNNPRIQFGIRSTLWVTAFAAVSLYWLHSKPAWVDFSVGEIQNRKLVLKPYTENQEFSEAMVSVTNRSPYTIWYWGDSVRERSDYVVLQEYQNRWNQCGFSTNTANWVALPAGNSLNLPIRLNDEASRLKVGLTLKGAMFGETCAKWSPAFTIRTGRTGEQSLIRECR